MTSKSSLWRQKHVKTSKSSPKKSWKVRHDVKNSMTWKSLSWRQKVRHDVKNISWWQKVRHYFKKFVMSKKKTSHDVKRFVMTSKDCHEVKNIPWCQWHQKHVFILFCSRNDEKNVMTIKSWSWHQKYVMTPKIRQYVKKLALIVRRKSHIGWNWSTDFFCRLIRVYIGLRQYFSEGVQNFVHWHFFKSIMAAATAKYH